MIAIPDFSAGAMENWGLVTYTEASLLYQPGVSSLSDKEYIAIAVAHELSHQWFGDLVTMEWWTDLWLNEGFARYTEYIGTDHVSPETEILDRFVVENLQLAMGPDSLPSSHPISVPVNDPAEIRTIFDTISYSKGGSVVRMMANFLGVETFNKGVTAYLHANSFSNADQDDLWGFLTVAGQEDGSLTELTVKQIMDTWTVQVSCDWSAGRSSALIGPDGLPGGGAGAGLRGGHGRGEPGEVPADPRQQLPLRGGGGGGLHLVGAALPDLPRPGLRHHRALAVARPRHGRHQHPGTSI